MVKNNVKQDGLMSDNLDVRICSLDEVTSVLVLPDDCKTVELDNYIDDSENERLKELDEYLTVLEDIGNLSPNECSTAVSFSFF